MRIMRILILEDNLKALNAIFHGLKELEVEIGRIKTVCFSEVKLAQLFLGEVDLEKFDVILLDKLSGDGKDFHEVVLGKVDPEKIIAISNTLAYNQEAMDKGVLQVVRKDYLDLNQFKAKIKKEIINIL